MTDRRRQLGFSGAVIGALVVAFVIARVVPFLGAHIGRGLDSYDYEANARQPPISRIFLAGPRPFGYPLYLKLARHNEHTAVAGQLVINTVAWIVLALTAARFTRNRALKVVAVFVVLALGASFDAIQWDRIVSSEALSTAFAIGVLVGLLWLRERFTVPRAAAVGVCALCATVLRDSNGTFFGLVAIVLVLAVVVRKLGRRWLTIAAVLLAVAAVSSVTASMGRRWQEPLTNVVTLRVLNSPERLAYFRRAGMPLTAAQIRAARDHCVVEFPSAGCLTLTDPAFYAWIDQHGRATYTASLVKFPATTLWEPFAHLRETTGARVEVELATGSAEKAPVSKVLDAVFFVRNPLLLACWSLAILALALAALARKRRGLFAVAAALVALAYPHLWLVWVGDADEVARHSVLASVQLRLGLWLGALWLLDAVLDRKPVPAPKPADQPPG